MKLNSVIPPLFFSLMICSFGMVASMNSSAGGLLKKQYTLESKTGNSLAPYRVPEGIAFDPFTNHFFATGLFGGRITRISGSTRVESTFFESLNPFVSFAGAVAAPVRRILWVCGADLVSTPNLPSSQLYAFDLDNGGVLKTFDLVDPYSPAFFCNDVTLDLQGNAYLTNSAGPSVMKVSPDAIDDPMGEAEVFTSSSLLLPDISVEGAVGQNGVVVTPTNSHLLVAISVPAKLIRISLENPTDITEVTFAGDALGVNPYPNGHPLDFFAPDGLQFVWGKLYVVYHGGIQKLSFTDFSYSHARIKSKSSEVTGLSTATRAYGRLYVIDSEVLPVTQPQFGLPVNLPNKILKVKLGGFD